MKTLPIILMATIFLFVSCGKKEEATQQKDAEIVKQIEEYQTQVDDLNKKIEELQAQLPKQQKNDNKDEHILVTTQKLENQLFEHFVEVNGTVEADEMAYISPEINGQIKKIHVREGQNVSKGQTLVILNTDVMDQTIKELEASLEFAITLFNKQKKLYDQNIGSEVDFLQAKNNKETLENKLKTIKAQRDMAIVKAPFSGVVDEIYVKEGELGMPGMRMMQLINLKKISVNADVSEAYLTKVKKGDLVLLRFPSYSIDKMEVPVSRVGNVIKTDNRTFNVVMELNNPDGLIKPNSLATVMIKDFKSDEALVIPSKLIKRDLKGAYLYKAVNGKASKVYIEVGASYKDKSMIAQGLEVGDQIIVEGFNQVVDNIGITTVE